MKPKAFFLIFLAGLTLSACGIEYEDDWDSQKCIDECATLNGQVTTIDGNASFNNVPIHITWHTNTRKGQLGGVVRNKAKGKTDSEGMYEISFTVRDEEINNGYYRVRFPVGDRYFKCIGRTPGFGVSRLVNDTVVTTNYYIPLAAYITFKATGTDLMMEGDRLSARVRSHFGVNGEKGCGGGGSWDTAYPDSEFTIQVAANQPLPISTVRTINGERTFTKDTLFLEAGERISYTVEFTR